MINRSPEMLLVSIAFMGCFIMLSSCDRTHPKIKSYSTTCEVYLSSIRGGHVEVITMEPNSKFPFTIPLQMFWHPPTSEGSLDLVVGYAGSNLGNIKSPDGARVAFKPLEGVAAEDYGAKVSAGENTGWRFGSSQLEVGFDRVNLSFPPPARAAIVDAIEKKKPIEVVIFNSNKKVKSAVFETNLTVERDKLFSQAKHLIEIRDPNICRRIEK